MALFKWFSGKTAAEHEKRADDLFAEQAWGKAKLEYERALDKLAAVAEPGTTVVQRLEEQIRLSCEALANDHIQNGMALMESGYPQDAADLFELALELSQDDQTHQRIAQLIEKSRPAPEWTATGAEADEDRKSEPVPANEVSEDHFFVLCSMLPDELQEIYTGYGASFQQGYVALHEGRFDQAAELLEAAQGAAVDDSSYISLELAGAYFNLGRLDEAVGLLEKFVQHHPEALPGYEILSDIYWEQNEFEKVRHLLEGCPAELQTSVAYIVLYGEAMCREDRYEEAEQWLTDHLQTYGWNDKIAIALASVYEQGGKNDDALMLYGRHMNNCRGCGRQAPIEVERKYADQSLAVGNHSDQILEIYLALAQKDPENASRYYLNASRIYTARGNPEEAQRFEEIARQLKTTR